MTLTVCREFSVRRDWLMLGNGAMFEESVDALAAQYGFNDMEKRMLETYARLPREARDCFRSFLAALEKRDAKAAGGNGEAAGEAPGLTPEDMAEIEAHAAKAADLARRQLIEEKKRASLAYPASSSGAASTPDPLKGAG